MVKSEDPGLHYANASSQIQTNCTTENLKTTVTYDRISNNSR